MAKGRPSKYSTDLVQRICAEIAAGKGLAEICKPAGMPHRDTIYAWLAEKQDFSDMYARAREMQADHHADEIVLIADTEEDPQRARVRIDARKWVAAKLRPRAYGDKQQVEHSGSIGLGQVLEDLDGRSKDLPGDQG